MVKVAEKHCESGAPDNFANSTDGRQRAWLFGDSSQDGAWVDRVKIPSGMRVLAYTHSRDDLEEDGPRS